MNTIAERILTVKQDLNRCALACGRQPEEVQLIAVSKTKPVTDIQEAVLAGQIIFGENKVQELVDKQAALPHLQWHLIGALQTNKVKYLIPFVHLIHSVDSWKLLQEIEKQASRYNRMVRILIQINISDEAQKSGTDEATAKEMLEKAEQFPHVIFKGLMGIAEDTEDKEKIRNQFARLRLAKESLMPFHNGKNVNLIHLSMGMTHDYPEAIAEGATLVRIGSAIFGGR